MELRLRWKAADTKPADGLLTREEYVRSVRVPVAASSASSFVCGAWWSVRDGRNGVAVEMTHVGVARGM